MKTRIIRITILTVLILFSFLNINTIFQSKKQNTCLMNIINTAGASGEQGELYDREVETTETQFKTENGETLSRSRSKTDCEGSGETECTPSDWSEWSEWS